METRFTDIETELVKSRFVFGLTGGMGSGKSTVSEGLRERGAVIVDADLIVRNLQQPGEPALNDMVRILGEGILNEDGSLNRAAASKRMFSGPDLREKTERVLGPHIRNRMFSELAACNEDDMAVLDVPLLLESGWHRLPLRGVMVVDTDIDNAVARLIEHRGFDEAEARRRIAVQMPKEQKLSLADFVVHNDGSREDLELEIEAAWKWMNSMRNTGRVAIVGESQS